MKIYIQKDHLEQALSDVTKIAQPNHHNQTLQGVRITTRPHMVIFESTNIEMSVEVRSPGESDIENSCVIPAKTFYDVVKLLSPGEIILSITEQVCTIQTKKGVINLTLLSPQEFPPLPKTQSKVKYILPRAQFIQGIQSVIYSASNSTIKPELASILVYSEGSSLVFVATDSFRLAEKKITYSSEEEFPTILIPAKNAHEIVSFLQNTKDEQVIITIDDDLCMFTTETIALSSRLTSGTFPEYRKIIPKQFYAECIMLKEDVASALKKAAIVSDATKQVTISVNTGEKNIVFTSKNTTTGEMSEHIVGTIEGQSLVLNFNQRYMIECFQSVPVDSVRFSFAGPSKPLIIQGVSDGSFLYVVMPMNK